MYLQCICTFLVHMQVSGRTSATSVLSVGFAADSHSMPLRKSQRVVSSPIRPPLFGQRYIGGIFHTQIPLPMLLSQWVHILSDNRSSNSMHMLQDAIHFRVAVATLLLVPFDSHHMIFSWAVRDHRTARLAHSRQCVSCLRMTVVVQAPTGSGHLPSSTLSSDNFFLISLEEILPSTLSFLRNGPVPPCVMAVTFCGSGFMPSLLTISSRNFNSVTPISHFSFLRDKPDSRHLSRTLRTEASSMHAWEDQHNFLKVKR